MIVKRLFFILILLMAFGLRWYHLDQLPAILNRDEAALAYNALLLQATGKDEWGKTWPLSLESFGDYKLPGYPYLLVGFFTIFGQHDWVVRLPAALAGTWLVVMGYLIGRQLKWRQRDCLVYMAVIAITPIMLFYSRMAWEAMVSLSFLVTSVWLLWSTFKSRSRLATDTLAICLMVAAVFTYNTAFILLPFLIPTVVMIRGWRRPQQWWWAAGGLTLLLVIAGFIFIPLTAQKSSITIFSDPTVYTQWLDYRASLSGPAQKILGNRYLFWLSLMATRTLETFSPNFLTIKGGTHPWHQVPGTAHLYWIIYILGMIGLVTTVCDLVRQLKKHHRWTRSAQLQALFLYALVVALLPSVMTVDAPHATRSLVFVWLFLWWAVTGWQRLEQWGQILLKRQAKALVGLVSLGVAGLLVIESYLYLQAYFGRYPHQQLAFRPGLAEALTLANQQYPGQPLVVVDEDGYTYILVAWYQKIAPDVYFSTTIRQQPDRIGFRYGQQVAQYHFVIKAADHAENETVAVEWRGDHWQVSAIP